MNLNLNYRKDTGKCINISFYFKMAKKKVTKSKPIKVIEEQSKSDFKHSYFFLSQAICTVDSKITFPLIFSHEFHLKNQVNFCARFYKNSYHSTGY